MQPAVNLLQKSPKAKTIEDIVKPDATMRLHQRLFDRRRKHHIDVQEDNSKSPGISLSTYLVSPKYRKKPKANQPPTLTTTTPMPVLQYSQITRDMPAEDYLASSANHVRSFMDRVSQRYQVFMSQHKPFYYSLSGGAASGWLTNPRARVALAGSALALLMFFTGTPYNPPEGPDNPVGKNPVVIQDTAKNTPPQSAENLETVNSTPPT